MVVLGKSQVPVGNHNFQGFLEMCSTSTAYHLGCHLQHPPLPNASWGRLCLDSCPVRSMNVWVPPLAWPAMHMVSFCVGDIGDIGSGEAVSLLFSCQGMNTLITWRKSHHRWCMDSQLNDYSLMAHRLEKMFQTDIKQRWATKQKNSKIIKTDTLLIHLFKKTWLIPSIYSIYLHLSARYQVSKNIGSKDPKLQRQNNKLLQLLWSLSPASLELQVFMGELAWRNDLCHCNLLDRY